MLKIYIYSPYGGYIVTYSPRTRAIWLHIAPVRGLYVDLRGLYVDLRGLYVDLRGLYVEHVRAICRDGGIYVENQHKKRKPLSEDTQT